MKWLKAAGMAAVIAMPTCMTYAQQAGETSTQPAVSGTLLVKPPEPVTKNGVTYLCGGVGVEEADMMKNRAPEYDLMLSFAAKQSGYLADVDVSIADADGNQVLKTFCGAPILLVQLPRNGAYRVKAETGGYTLEQKVVVNTDRQQAQSVVMLWPHQLAESVDPMPAATSTGDSGTTGTSGSGSEEEFDYRTHQ